jgi:hypothetical protein
MNDAENIYSGIYHDVDRANVSVDVSTHQPGQPKRTGVFMRHQDGRKMEKGPTRLARYQARSIISF